MKGKITMPDAQAQGIVEDWLRLMETYPSDGWDGAAEVIGKHDARVCALERELDAANPGWHSRLDSPPHRRTQSTV